MKVFGDESIEPLYIKITSFKYESNLYLDKYISNFKSNVVSSKLFTPSTDKKIDLFKKLVPV